MNSLLVPAAHISKGLLGSALALALLWAPSCQKHGVCDNLSGSCLALHVEGEGAFDALSTTLHLDGDAAKRTGDTAGEPPSEIELPLTLRVVPPPEVLASQVRMITVDGLRGSYIAATAASEPGFTWPEGSHVELSLRLRDTATLPDGGSAADLGAQDMTTPSDMGSPVDLKWRSENNAGKANLYGVFAGSATRAYAVGEGGLVLSRQSDGTWRSENAGTNQTLNGITGLASGSVWAVGKNPGAWRRGGTSWGQDVAALNLGTNGELLTVCGGATAGELWAGASDGRVWHRTGPADRNGTWQTPEQVFPSGNKVYGIGSAGGAVFAVGDQGHVAVRRDSAPGTPWQQFQYSALPTGDPFTINSVWAFDKNTAVAVGSGGRLVRYQSGAWQSTIETINPQGSELFGVYGERPERVFAVGENGLILRIDGTQVTELARSTPQRLYGIYGRSETDIYVVGYAMGASLILHGTP